MSELKAEGMSPVDMPAAGMFGDEGQRVLDEHGVRLFPVTVRPVFLRLLWAALAVVAIAGGAVVVGLAGRLS